MSKLSKLIITIPVWIIAASSASAQENYQPSPEIVKAQEQFRDNRFGIFIHWGIYSMYGQGEWALNYNGRSTARWPGASILRTSMRLSG